MSQDLRALDSMADPIDSYDNQEDNKEDIDSYDNQEDNKDNINSYDNQENILTRLKIVHKILGLMYFMFFKVTVYILNFLHETQY